MKSLFSSDVAIDLGTANTLVYTKGRGLIVDEPSVVAIQCFGNQRKVIAVGNEAKSMLGKTSRHTVAVRPLKDGVIADFEVAEEMIKYFTRKALKGSRFTKPDIVICVPSGATSVERKAIHDAAVGAGGKEVYLVDEPMAAAIGAGLPVENPHGFMVVDIGGGTTEIAVISLGGVVLSHSLRVAGDVFDETIVRFVRQAYGLIIGESSAERIKMQLASIDLDDYKDENFLPEPIVVKGRDGTSGLPKEIKVEQKKLAEALQEPLNNVAASIRISLEQTPPELCSDIVDDGIILTGGGALLKGLSHWISKKVELSVHVPEHPLLCVLLGVGKILDAKKKHQKGFEAANPVRDYK